jgi:phosphoserine aminotransferase
MSEEKQQKFTSKVRRGLTWVYAQAHAELERNKAAAGGGRVAGFNAGELADVEAALLWIEQNKEPKAGTGA